MAAPTPKTVGAYAREAKETKGWNAEIVLVSVFGAVFLASLVSVVVIFWKTKRKAKQMATGLDNAMAELGAQKNRAASLERRLKRQEAFIDRNVLGGPEAYSVASPELCPRQPSHPGPDEAPTDHLFVVGSDDEDDDETPRSPTPVAAVVVRRGAIRTIDIQPKGLQNRGAGFDTTVSQGRQPQDSVQGARKAQPWYDVDKVVPFEGLKLQLHSQAEVPRAQITRYWQTDPIETARGTPPRLDNAPAEVNPTATEADRGRGTA
jgi:hypothetical protein